MDVSQLKRIPLFSEVPDDALQKIAPFATTEEWPEGKEIIKEGGSPITFTQSKREP